jgi:micrococcal nuclease
MRRRRLLPLVALLIAAASLVLVESRSGDGEGDASALITRVVDGDTVAVRLAGRTEKVRYIGIDTPESVKPGTPVECFGKAAAAQNRRLVANRRVTLRFDGERRDRYGRLLAYVYRRDDGLFVNAALVSRGFAKTLTIPPNVGHAGQFARLARRARQRKLGLWLACPS